MSRETHDEFLYTLVIDGQEYDVFGTFIPDSPAGTYEHYDVCNAQGTCINKGDPFYERPTLDSIRPVVDRWMRPDEPPADDSVSDWEEYFPIERPDLDGLMEEVE